MAEPETLHGRIVAFLRERDMSLLPDERSDEEYGASAHEICNLIDAASSPARTDADGVREAIRQEVIAEMGAEFRRSALALVQHELSKPKGETGPAVAEPVAYAKPRGEPWGMGDNMMWADERTEEWMRKVYTVPLFAALTVSPSPSERDQHQGETDGWMPIETAPKDGTTIDLWHEDFGRQADCYWGKSQHECGEAGRYCDSDWHSEPETWIDATFNSALFLDGEFTHWRPLPASPRAALSTPEAVPVADKREGGANG